MWNLWGIHLPSLFHLALDLARKDGKLSNGDTLLLYGFGGGLTHLGLM
ncbi:3-oxoacyl-[acyl-carrier-protein] synthase III C-terminal domain-containing protein [Bacillus pacificus]